MDLYIFMAVAVFPLAWLFIGFAARCLLKNFVYEMRSRYGRDADPPAKVLWKKNFGRLQYAIILKGYFGLKEVENILDASAQKTDSSGNQLRWEDRFRL